MPIPSSTTVHYNPNCLFCKIINGEIKCHKLIETQYSFSFLDTHPTTPGHILIVPKYHASKLHDIRDQYLTDILPVAKRFAQALDLTEGDNGYNILQNNGRIASQDVEHVHFHFIPKRDVKSGLLIGWPAKEADKNQLAMLHSQIQDRLHNP